MRKIETTAIIEIRSVVTKLGRRRRRRGGYAGGGGGTWNG
jgi:hypothetical protein